ncbi:MAG: HEPN domain-containing protein [Candidatus Eisenbacteria sp.]|nr:HEPN domain-containing protein [Candidatus Eisenbacteria bacterium]
MNADLDLAKQWVQKARNDLLHADNNLVAAQVPADTVCFHCQQAAEKLLKGFLVGKSIPPPRTHDLIDLYSRILTQSPDIKELREALLILQPYAVDVRYPDADWMPTVEEAIDARKAAGSILTWFERALPEAVEG